MFQEFFRFELSYWFRGVMVYVFFAAMALIYGLAASSEFVEIGATWNPPSENFLAISKPPPCQ